MTEIKKLVLSAEERETIILFNDSSDECLIYTCSRPIMTKLDKLTTTNPKTWKLVAKDKESKTYATSKRLISYRAEVVKPKQTEEQKKASADRMRKLREKF